MQSKQPFPERLTAEKKQQIVDLFAPYNVDIKRIDKTAKGYIRIWYNTHDTIWECQ